MTSKETPGSGPGPTVRELAAKGIILFPSTIAEWLWNYTTVGVARGILELKSPPGQPPKTDDLTLAETLGYKREWIKDEYDDIEPVYEEG